MQCQRLIFAFACSLFLTVARCGLQRVLVRGRLLCGSSPASDIQLKLYDLDVGPDDLLDEKRSNVSGEFLLDGWTREFTNIDAVLKVYHDCDDDLWCQRRLHFHVPKKYINHGERINFEQDYEALRILDIGVINLETYISGEDRDCFHKK